MAPIVTKIFYPLVKMHARLIGKPHLRIVSTPHPISRVPATECRKYIEGNNPVTGQPIIEEIIKALTQPLSPDEMAVKVDEKTEPRLISGEDEESLHDFFIKNKMSDFLPVLLPTEKRVAALLKGTSHQPDEVVGELRSGYQAGTFTVEKVAANAVMAGARPEYLPVILAMARSGVAAISTSTQSFARMIMVNGPVRNEIKMNYGTGALSPFNQANAVIGRVANLLSINLGAGGIPNLTYWGSQGNNLNYNHVTFAENEEALPAGWKPFHTQHGFKPEESAISFFHGYGIWHWKNTSEEQKHRAILRMSDWVLPSGTYASGYTLLLDPIVADHLVSEGFSTKESLSRFVHENSKLSLEEFWKFHLVEGLSLPAAQKGVEPYASWLKQPGDTLINRFRRPDEISVVVVGGRTNDFWQAGDWRHMITVSIDEWR